MHTHRPGPTNAIDGKPHRATNDRWDQDLIKDNGEKIIIANFIYQRVSENKKNWRVREIIFNILTYFRGLHAKFSHFNWAFIRWPLASVHIAFGQLYRRWSIGSSAHANEWSFMFAKSSQTETTKVSETHSSGQFVRGSSRYKKILFFFVKLVIINSTCGGRDGNFSARIRIALGWFN